MEKEQVQTNIIEILESIFKLLGVEADVSFLPERSSTDKDFFVSVASPDSNILIGYHGETLNSFQQVLNAILFKKYAKDAIAVLDVGGYRIEREQKLLDMAQTASEKARFLGRPIALPALNAYERKLIHQRVSEIEGVSSLSEGEGHERRVIISPVSQAT